MELIHQTLTRGAARQTLRPRPVTQHLMRPKHPQRYYASSDSPSQEKSGSQRGLLIAAALAVPAAYYYMNKGDAKKAVGDISGEHHGASQEYKKGGEGNN